MWCDGFVAPSVCGVVGILWSEMLFESKEGIGYSDIFEDYQDKARLQDVAQEIGEKLSTSHAVR